MYSLIRKYKQSTLDQYPCKIESIEVESGNIKARIIAYQQQDEHSAPASELEVELTFEDNIPKPIFNFYSLCKQNGLDKYSASFSFNSDPEYTVYNSKHPKDKKTKVPDSFLRLYQSLANDLDTAAEKLPKIAEWHTGCSQPSTYIPDTTRLVTDTDDWFIPVTISDTFIVGRNATSMDSNILEHLNNCFDSEGGMPIYQNMLLEAKFNFRRDSSFAIAVAALEVATKYTVTKLLPETSWILNNLPSPPVYNLLKHQIPLAAASKNMTPSQIPDELLSEIRKAINIRNEIVHTGICKLDSKRRHSFIESIEDTILYLEWFQGDTLSLRRLSFKESARLLSNMKE